MRSPPQMKPLVTTLPTINVEKCPVSAFFTLLNSCISQGKFRVGHELNMKSNVLCAGYEAQFLLRFIRRL